MDPGPSHVRGPLRIQSYGFAPEDLGPRTKDGPGTLDGPSTKVQAPRTFLLQVCVIVIENVTGVVALTFATIRQYAPAFTLGNEICGTGPGVMFTADVAG